MSDPDGHKQQTANFWHALNVYCVILSRIHPVLDQPIVYQINQVQELAQTMWSLVKKAAYTQNQNLRNRSKNPDSVGRVDKVSGSYSDAAIDRPKYY